MICLKKSRKWMDSFPRAEVLERLGTRVRGFSSDCLKQRLGLLKLFEQVDQHPPRSLGSNHVLLGGIKRSASATSRADPFQSAQDECHGRCPNPASDRALWPRMPPTNKIRVLVLGLSIPRMGPRMLSEVQNIQPPHHILRNHIWLGLEAMPLAIEIHCPLLWFARHSLFRLFDIKVLGNRCENALSKVHLNLTNRLYAKI